MVVSKNIKKLAKSFNKDAVIKLNDADFLKLLKDSGVNKSVKDELFFAITGRELNKKKEAIKNDNK